MLLKCSVLGLAGARRRHARNIATICESQIVQLIDFDVVVEPGRKIMGNPVLDRCFFHTIGDAR
jgi:hypothetical protein